MSNSVTLWTGSHQPSLSMGFSRQEYWTGSHSLLQGIFPTQGSNPGLLHLLYWQVGSLLLVPTGKPFLLIGHIYFTLKVFLGTLWGLISIVNRVSYSLHAAAAAKSLQSCPTLCDPVDGSPPGSPVPGILQARTLKWVAISFSNAWKWKVKVKSLSRVRLCATP